jgi:hypothetical protein
MSDAAPGISLHPADLQGLVARRFPLVPRSKPTCQRLHARIARVANPAT